MEDIAPGLLEKIEKEFDRNIKSSRIIQALYEKVRLGRASYDEANEFAVELGGILADAYKMHLSSGVLPDGKMYYNIANRVLTPTMEKNYQLITEVTERVQKKLNQDAGIGIRPLVPDLNRDRIEKIVHRVADADTFDNVSWILDEPVKNFSQSIVDDSIRVNAEFQYQSGMTPIIERRLVGGCCEWCSRLAGEYEYPDVPKDVYRRHQRCRCKVLYRIGKFYQDVHSGLSYDEKGNALNQRNLEKGKLKVRSREEAAMLESALEKERKNREKQRLEQLITEYRKENNVSHRRAANRIGRMLREDASKETVKELRKNVGLKDGKGIEKSVKGSRIKLPDIPIGKSVGAKFKNHEIIDKNTGELFHFVEGTKIQNAEVFAGKGTHKALREEVVQGLNSEYHINSSSWQHCKGHGIVDFYGEERPAEVHWFQEETIGKVKFKIKVWEDEG